MAPLFDNLKENCIDCGLCVKECSFLTKYGSPLDLIRNIQIDQADITQDIAFECSLCGLCVSVCPKSIDLVRLFLEMRKKAVQDNIDLSSYSPILNYEKKGASGMFSWYALPRDCDTVFFPGCALPGSRPNQTFKTYQELEKQIPSLGIVLDCCTKPSHDLGRSSVFDAMFGEMKTYLIDRGVKQVLTACPNCYSIFKTYGKPLEVRSIYEVLEEHMTGGPDLHPSMSTVTVHDPCVLRNDTHIQDAVRQIIKHTGHHIEEMSHTGKTTFCCGEGGSVPYVCPEHSDSWTNRRKKEAQGKSMICYCAGCTYRLDCEAPAHHILDLYFDPETTLAGKSTVSHPPMTYINRLLLKQQIKKTVPAVISRKRPFVPDGIHTKTGIIKPLIFFVILISMFVVLKIANMGELFKADVIDSWVRSYGMLAPMVFILIYSLAPVLFLPALPLTLAAGVLFGPFWGVVYSITGATSGACLSFLFTRYFARDLFLSKLRSPKWKTLDNHVKEHGWKVVALTRLIPLFPFNLLNYAFGLTRIGFGTYAITSFICMLPACIAFIVFSSSLTDLVKGHVSLEFIIGILLILLVSSFPMVYRWHKRKKSTHEQVSSIP